MIEIKAPNPLPYGTKKPCIFLAGSIEMGKAELWQDEVVKALNDLDVIILNPRRDDWDSTWVQSVNNTQFLQQVNWELEAMEKCAQLIPMFFYPKTYSPITLLEFGLFTRTKKLLVYCPEGFWRKGNVDIVCRKYNIDQVDTYDGFIATIRNTVSSRL